MLEDLIHAGTRPLRWRAFAAALLLLLLLAVSSDRTRGASSALAAHVKQPAVNLCALFPSGPDYDVRPAGGTDGASAGCQVYDLRPDHVGEFLVASISNIYSSYGAQSKVQSYIDLGALEPGQPKWEPAGYGDPGFGYQYAGFEAATDTTERSARIVFSRGCYFFSGDAGWWNDGKNLFNNDLSGISAIAGSVDGQLAGLPCDDNTGGTGNNGGTSGISTVEPTATNTEVVEEPTATATSTAEVDITVDHIEVVQVIQTEDNEIPLVAGKSTVVRVFLKVDGKTEASRKTNYTIGATLTIWPEGGSETPVDSAYPYVTQYTGPGPGRDKLEGSINFVVPINLTAAGQFSLHVVANPDRSIAETDYDNNELTQPFEFVQRKPLRVGFVRIGYSPPSQSTFSWPQSDVSKFDTYLKKIYPVADADVQYYEMPWRIRTTGSAYTTGLGENLNLYLRDFYDRLEGDKPDVLVGWISSEFAQGFEYGGLAETAIPGVLGRVAIAIDNPAATHYSTEVLAHEVGHDLGLEHTATTGDTDTLCRVSKGTTRGYWPEEYFNSAAIRIQGLDVAEMKLIPGTNYDIMSYCSYKVWISKFHYMKIFDQNVLPAQVNSTGIAGRILIRGWGLLRSGAGEPRFEMIQLPKAGGGSTPPKASGGSVMDFADSLLFAGTRPRSVAFQSEGTGDYGMRFVDANNQGIYERWFDLNFKDGESLEPVDDTGFVLTVPAPASAYSRVVLIHSENGVETALATVQSTGAPPKISIISPKSGDSWEGEHTIEWTFEGSDSQDLRFDVSYSPDGKKTWYPLEVGTYDTSYTFSTDEILPGEQTYIRVGASDGFDTTYEEAGPFSVPQQLNQPAPPPPPPSGIVADTGTGSGSGSDSGSGTTGTGSTTDINDLKTRFALSRWFEDNWKYVAVGGGALLVLVVFALTRRSRRKAPAYSPPNVPTSGTQPYVPPAPQQPQRYTPPPAAPMPAPPQRTQFDLAVQEYGRLRYALLNGHMSQQDFSAAVARLTVQDAQGVQWRLGEADGAWYYFDGRGWVRGG